MISRGNGFQCFLGIAEDGDFRGVGPGKRGGIDVDADQVFVDDDIWMSQKSVSESSVPTHSMAIAVCSID